MSDAGDGCRDSRDPGAVHQEGGTGREAGGVRHGVLVEAVGEKLEAVLGKIKDDREQRKQWTSHRESTRKRKADMECHTCHQKGHFTRPPPPPPKDGRETGDRRTTGGGERSIPAGTDC